MPGNGRPGGRQREVIDSVSRGTGAAIVAVMVYHAGLIIAITRGCSLPGRFDIWETSWAVLGSLMSSIFWIPAGIVVGLLAWRFLPALPRPAWLVLGFSLIVLTGCVTWLVVPLGPGECVI